MMLREPIDWKRRWDDYCADVEKLAAARWPEILAAVSSGLQPALERYGKGVSCPSHGGKSGQAFRLYTDRSTGECVGICNTCGGRKGARLLAWADGIDNGTAVRLVGEYLGRPWRNGAKSQSDREAPMQPRAAPPVIKTLPPVDPVETMHDIERAWEEAKSVNWRDRGNPIVRYLINRGLEGILRDPPRDLRLHPGMTYSTVIDKERKYFGKWPTMLALMRTPRGLPVNVHRTFLSPEGTKAPVPGDEIKKPMRSPFEGASRGAAIRLYPANGPVLGVGEGIETMLAVRLLRSSVTPVWSCANASLLAKFEVPENVLEHLRQLQIYADNDLPEKNKDRGVGEIRARELRDRYPQLDPKIYMPNQPGTDYLDSYKTRSARREIQPVSRESGKENDTEPEAGPVPAYG